MYLFIRLISILITSFIFGSFIIKALSLLQILISPTIIIGVMIIGTVILLALNLKSPISIPSGSDKPSKCIPAIDCSQLPCGSKDSCGNTCTNGTCSTKGDVCSDGQCKCIPAIDCSQLPCGSKDSCGNTCTNGTCSDGKKCINFECKCIPAIDCSQLPCGSKDSCGNICNNGTCTNTYDSCVNGVCNCTAKKDCIGCGGNNGCGQICPNTTIKNSNSTQYWTFTYFGNVENNKLIVEKDGQNNFTLNDAITNKLYMTGSFDSNPENENLSFVATIYADLGQLTFDKNTNIYTSETGKIKIFPLICTPK